MVTLVHQSLTNCQAYPRHAESATTPRSGLPSRLAATLGLWRGRLRERRELGMLDARDLRDIGVSSSDVWHELREPFWRATPRR